jgi:signal transduction histidine kinase
MRCRQISHDIHHELGTISVLATLLSGAPELEADSRARARLVLSEIRWLDQLLRAYEEWLPGPPDPSWRGPREQTRLDLIAADVVDAVRLSGPTRIEFDADEVMACVDRLAFWRVLRNVLQNAVRAAGPSGRVQVRITAKADLAVVCVDDDGPGFEAAPPDPGALGLGIVQDIAASWDGNLEIMRSLLGGGRVQLRVPTAPPTGPARVEGRIA